MSDLFPNLLVLLLLLSDISVVYYDVNIICCCW